MSETLSQDPSHGPDTLTSGYTLAPPYPSATSISEPSGINLPPFSTFSADIEGNGSFSTFGDTRLLDISNWDCYTETRLDRSDNGISIITSQPQYRPWESKPVDTGGVTTFADAFASQNGSSPRLPSFQSQFQAFNDQVTTTETTTLTTLTPVSPSSTNQNITTLGNFHSLNPRNYPLVPAPIQAREIPSIQQQFIDERHIQLYTHPSGFSQSGAVIQNIGAPTVVTMLKSEPIHQLQEATGIKIQNITTLHHNQFQNSLSTVIETNCGNNSYNHIEKKNTNVSGSTGNTGISPSKLDYRKKERRKARASSLESSNESDGASSNMDITSVENSGQVAAISSTASFKHQNNSIPSGITNSNAASSDLLDADEISGCVDKQVKKKRKRCGECIGCQRKDNCGDCAPCRNDKSHQICKQRRCEKLTEKKNIYGENGFVRDGSRRGRGKSRRGGGSYRGRKAVANSESKITINAADSATAVNKGVLGMVGRGEQMSNSPSSTIQRPHRQDAHHLQKPSITQSVPVIEAAGLTLPVATQQPITCSTIQQSATLSSVPFYTDPNRFTTSVWQTDPSATWTQSQFIQHLSSNSATPIETTYTSQQYPNSIYQPTVYTQPGFEPMTANTYYTGAVQVLTNRPPSVFTQQEHPQQLTTRACGSTASYTSSPSPSHQPSRPQSTHQLQYETHQLSSSVAMSQTPSDTHSRPSSVSSNATTPSIYTGSSQQQQNNPTYNLNVNNNTSYGSASTTMRHVAPEAQESRRGSPGSTTLDYRIERNEKHPQLSEEISLSSNEYPVSYNDDEIISNETHSKKWTNPETVIWESNNQQQNASNRCSDQEISRNSNQLIQHRVEINSKLKTMILKKYEKTTENEDEPNSKATGHFLLNSHRYCAVGQLNNGGNKYIRILENSQIFWDSQTIKPRKISGSNMITSLTVVMKKIKRKWFGDSCLLMF